MSMFQPEDAFIESFINPDGSFSNSICLDQGQNTQIPFQRHVDIRSFIQNDITFINGNVYIKGENWTSSGTAPTVGPQSGYNYLNGMTASLASGANSLWSITSPVDIYTGFEEFSKSGFVSLACPAWPSQINVAQSYIDITSDPAGSFSNNTTAISLSLSTMPTTTTDVEIRIPRSAFEGGPALLTSITGVRLRLQTTAICTFTCLAIRFLPATWDAAPVDINTRLKGLVAPATRAGTLNSYEFPVATNPGAQTSAWPILYRQTQTSSSMDDITHVVRFYTGQMAATNQINTYYRVISNEGTTQGDLDGKTMASLDGFPQPDTTNNGQVFSALNMATLDTFQVNYLDSLDMQQLDAIPSSTSGDWLEVDLSWGTSGSTLLVKNRDGFQYSFTPTLTANTYYALIVELEDSTIRLQIWKTDPSSGARITQVLDSSLIADPEMIINRTGLVGWYAQLGDGNAACLGITASYTSFGNYTSTPIQSQTPVVGASIYAESTPDLVLTDTLKNGLFGGTIYNDASKSPTAQRVTILGSSANQGVQTDPFWIYDWDNTVIQFRLFVPPTMPDNPLSVVLLNQDMDLPTPLGQSVLTNGNSVTLALPNYTPGAWQNYTLYTEAFDTTPTGLYTFNILAPNLSQTFWIDDFVIFTRNYSWTIRNGAFGDNSTTLGWTRFLESKNGINMGASLDSQATSFQIAAEQLQAGTKIQGLAIVPYYAHRSKLVWDN